MAHSLIEQEINRGYLDEPDVKETTPGGSDVDIVYTWVDGNDSDVRRELNYHIANSPERSLDKHSTGDFRFRDNDELKYSLRSVELFAPWIRHVFIVTNGQKPKWLNLDHPKISLINHDQIFSDKAHLPTFNSEAIECHLHKIPGLAKEFFYFNDDVFLGRDVTREDFFDAAIGYKIRMEHWGISPARQARPVHDHSRARAQELLNAKFGLTQDRKNPAHLPFFILRTLFEEIEHTWPEAFERTSSLRFRSEPGIAPMYLYTHYIIDKGLPCVIKVMGRHAEQEYMFAEMSKADLHNILRVRPKFFVINDLPQNPEIKLSDYLSQCYPRPSSFELPEGFDGGPNTE